MYLYRFTSVALDVNGCVRPEVGLVAWQVSRVGVGRDRAIDYRG